MIPEVEILVAMIWTSLGIYALDYHSVPQKYHVFTWNYFSLNPSGNFKRKLISGSCLNISANGGRQWWLILVDSLTGIWYQAKQKPLWMPVRDLIRLCEVGGPSLNVGGTFWWQHRQKDMEVGKFLCWFALTLMGGKSIHSDATTDTRINFSCFPTYIEDLPSILQAFWTWLGVLRYPAFWTDQLPDYWTFWYETAIVGLPRYYFVSQHNKSPLIYL